MGGFSSPSKAKLNSRQRSQKRRQLRKKELKEIKLSQQKAEDKKQTTPLVVTNPHPVNTNTLRIFEELSSLRLSINIEPSTTSTDDNGIETGTTDGLSTDQSLYTQNFLRNQPVYSPINTVSDSSLPSAPEPFFSSEQVEADNADLVLPLIDTEMTNSSYLSALEATLFGEEPIAYAMDEEDDQLDDQTTDPSLTF